jgi:alpha-tubulin suppressor-like RCC1 family protein
MWCFGLGNVGQLGDGSKTSNVAGLSAGFNYTSVVAGGNGTCGMKSTTAYCWGQNSFGELGVGTGEKDTPVQIAGAWSSLAMGAHHTCGVRTDHTLWCWGDNRLGQVGDPAQPGDVTAETQIGTDTDWEAVSAGDGSTCATKLTHALYCWGSNDDGELGEGTGWSTSFVVVP